MDDPFAAALKSEEPSAAMPAMEADPFASALKPKEEYKDEGDQVSRYTSRIPPEDPNADQVSRAHGKYPEPATPLFQDIVHRNDLMRIFDVQSQKQAIHNDIAAQYAKEHGIDEPRKWTLKHQQAVNDLMEKAYKDSKPPAPDVGIGEVFKQAFDVAVSEPTKFAGEMLKELVANPQYMTPLTAEFGFANVVKNMGKATAAVKAGVRAADAGVMGAAITLPGTLTRQQLEHGEATLKDTGTDLAMAAATTAGMQAVVAGAVALGGKIAAKRTGSTFTPENAQKAVTDASKAIEEGTPSDIAVRQVLDEMKVPEAAADAIEQGVKEATAKPHIKPKSSPDQIGAITPEPKIDLALEDLPRIDPGMLEKPSAAPEAGTAPVHSVDYALQQKMVGEINADKGKSWLPLALAMKEGLASLKVDGVPIPKLETVKDVVRLVTDSEMPDMWKVLVNAVLPGVEDVPIKFRDTGDALGKYRFGRGTDEIQINPNRFNPNKPWEFLQTVIHEAEHARVATTIDTQPHAPPVKALDQLFTYVRDTFRGLDPVHQSQFGGEPYGLKNLHEFVSEVRSNPRFQDELRAFELPEPLVKQLQKTLGEKEPGLFRTAWNALTTLYGKIMGVAPKDMRAFATAHDLVSRLERYVTPAERQRSNEAFLDAGKRTALASEALKVGEIAPILNNPKLQEGKVDPKLLAALGLGSAGAAATWIFTQDPLKSGIAGLAGAALTLAAAKPVRSVLHAMGFHADQRFRITDLTDQFSGMIATGELGTERMRKRLMTDLGKTSDARLKVMRDWMESDPSTPQGQAFRRSNPLTAREQAFVNAVETGFDGAKQKLLALGMDPAKFFDQYITHLWVPGLNTQKSVWDNLRAGLAERSNDISPGMSPNSRFTMRRSIPTYAEGERLGLMPVTNNPAAILQIYLNNVNRALANKQLQNALLRERTPWGERLMVVDMPEPAMREVIKRDAIAASQLQLDPADKKIFQDLHSSIRAPRDYVTIDHPQMRGFKVLKDIEAPLKHLYDANDPSVATKMAYAVSVAAKRALFSWSLFHAKSLLDALLGAGPMLVAKLPAAKRALEDAGAAGDAVKELVGAGLRVTGRPIEGDITPFTNALRLFGEKYPIVGAPAKAVNWVTQKMDHFLWDVVHPTFKAAAGLAQYEKELAKRPNVPREQVAKEVASYVNDVFGSVDWFRIADGVSNKYGRDLALAVTSPSGRRFMQILMWAPDWTVATGRSLLKAVPGISTKEIGAMHRAYFARSALLYLTVADGLNMAFSGHHLWDNEDPTTVDLGDGRRLQLSKHFMEGIHWLTKPGQQALNKLGYVVSEPLKQMFNQEYLATKGAPPIVPPSNTKISQDPEKWAREALTNTKDRAMHALKAPLPITAQNALTNTPGSVVAGFLGFPILGKNEEQAVQAARERAEKQGKDVSAAERRVRNVYRKKQQKQDALR